MSQLIPRSTHHITESSTQYDELTAFGQLGSTDNSLSQIIDQDSNSYLQDLSYIEAIKFKLNKLQEELKDEIDDIPESAYRDASNLLKDINKLEVKEPELGWAEDRSLSLTWFFDSGSATIGLYGDNIAIFSIYLEEKRQIKGVCDMVYNPILYGFLDIVQSIYRHGKVENITNIFENKGLYED